MCSRLGVASGVLALLVALAAMAAPSPPAAGSSAKVYQVTAHSHGVVLTMAVATLISTRMSRLAVTVTLQNTASLPVQIPIYCTVDNPVVQVIGDHGEVVYPLGGILPPKRDGGCSRPPPYSLLPNAILRGQQRVVLRAMHLRAAALVQVGRAEVSVVTPIMALRFQG